jgi:predicted P-loop ATPase
VKLDELTQDREQIWAEAVDLYRSGARWWLNKTDEGAAAAVVATRAAEDPWEADVLRVVQGMNEVSTRDVFERLDIDIDRRSKADAMRITGILTRTGWERKGKYTSGASRNLSRYVARKGGDNV